jgi:hypothetical protein
MAWIESHQGIERHPKTLQLAHLMGWSVDETIGKMHRFWWWSLDYAPTGDLRGFSKEIIGQSLGLTEADSLKFIDNLVTTHLVCRLTRTRLPWRIHDWLDYAGRYLRDTRFKRHPEKWLETVELYKIKCQPTVSRQSADLSTKIKDMSAVPNQPNQPTNQNLSSDSVEIGLAMLLFEKILERKPDHKKPNIQQWGKHIGLMIREDHRSPDRIREVIVWCQQDEFWKNNILSTEKLRKQFDKLELKADSNNGESPAKEERRGKELHEWLQSARTEGRQK